MGDPTRGLADLVAVVDHGSVTAGARALGIPRTTLSRRLASLERDLGVALLHRTTRRLTLTRAGQALVEAGRRVIAEARAAREQIQREDDVPRGLLRITMPPGPQAARWVPLLETFLDAHPQVRLEVLAVSRAVDLRAEGFDLAIRAGEVGDPSLVARVLFRGELRAYATPAYLAAHPIERVEDLARAVCTLGFGTRTGWPLRRGGTVAVSGRFVCNDIHFHHALARGGRAVALLPDRLAEEDVAAGRLVQVLPEVLGAPGPVRLVWPAREHLDPKVRAFVDHAVAWTAANGG